MTDPELDALFFLPEHFFFFVLFCFFFHPRFFNYVFHEHHLIQLHFKRNFHIFFARSCSYFPSVTTAPNSTKKENVYTIYIQYMYSVEPNKIIVSVVFFWFFLLIKKKRCLFDLIHFIFVGIVIVSSQSYF